MQKIHIIADSPCDLPHADVDAHGIEILPVTITYEGVSRREFYDIDPKNFWNDLSRLDEIPTTAQIIPMVFIDAYKRAAANGCTHVIVITISATASGTYTSALLARDLYHGECGDSPVIEVVDSRGYSMVYGQIVRHAAIMCAAGAKFSEILAKVTDMTLHMQALFLVFSLKHMRKSGRIHGGMAFVGEALGLRPILRVYDGYIDVIAKARGDKNVVLKSVALMQEYIDNPSEQTITILYSSIPKCDIELAETLVDRTFNPAAIELVELGCSVSANTGPNMLGIVFHGKSIPWPERH